MLGMATWLLISYTDHYPRHHPTIRVAESVTAFS